MGLASQCMVACGIARTSFFKTSSNQALTGVATAFVDAKPTLHRGAEAARGQFRLGPPASGTVAMKNLRATPRQQRLSGLVKEKNHQSWAGKRTLSTSISPARIMPQSSESVSEPPRRGAHQNSTTMVSRTRIQDNDGQERDDRVSSEWDCARLRPRLCLLRTFFDL